MLLHDWTEYTACALKILTKRLYFFLDLNFHFRKKIFDTILIREQIDPIQIRNLIYHAILFLR